jgi:hypothetical protein
VPADHLRAGTVKARRPRACAGGAKRSALHDAEHRCSIVVVMAVVSDARQPGSMLDQNAHRYMLNGWHTNIACDTISRTISWKHLSGNRTGRRVAPGPTVPGNARPVRPDECGRDHRQLMAQTHSASRRPTYHS